MKAESLSVSLDFILIDITQSERSSSVRLVLSQEQRFFHSTNPPRLLCYRGHASPKHLDALNRQSILNISLRVSRNMGPYIDCERVGNIKLARRKERETTASLRTKKTNRIRFNILLSRNSTEEFDTNPRLQHETASI